MRPLLKRFLLEATSLLDVDRRLAKIESDIVNLQEFARMDLEEKIEKESQKAFVLRMIEEHPEITYKEFEGIALKERPEANIDSLRTTFYRLRNNQF